MARIKNLGIEVGPGCPEEVWGRIKEIMRAGEGDISEEDLSYLAGGYRIIEDAVQPPQPEPAPEPELEEGVVEEQPKPKNKKKKNN